MSQLRCRPSNLGNNYSELRASVRSAVGPICPCKEGRQKRGREREREKERERERERKSESIYIYIGTV